MTAAFVHVHSEWCEPVCILKRDASWVWEQLEAQPGFSEALAEGEAQIAAGLVTPLREIRREAD